MPMLTARIPGFRTTASATLCGRPIRESVIVEPAGSETRASAPIALCASMTAPGSTCDARRSTRRSIDTSMVARAGISF
jgi:hypothetical protein